MKRKSILTLFIIVLLLCSGCAKASNKGFYLYRSSPLGFRVEYPSSWTKQVDLEAKCAAFITPMEGYGDAYRDNLAVSYEGLGEYTFEEFFDKYYASLPSVFAGFTEIEKSEVLLDGKDAYKIVFSSESTNEEGQEVKLKIMQYIALDDERVYFVTYSAAPSSYDYFLSFVNTMMETFSFSV